MSINSAETATFDPRIAAIRFLKKKGWKIYEGEGGAIVYLCAQL